jgi:TRAP-type C4-dicarboxylate transport system permease small subunit
MPDTRPPPLPPALTSSIRRLAWILALAGGAVLVVLTVITDTSIIGRVLIPFGLRPIQGDFEMVETGTAFAIFSFMPWCQFNRGHASVDVFTSRLPPVALRVIDLVVDLAFAAVITVIVWRMGVGLLDKYANHQTTFILQVPLWWTYAGGMVGAVAWVVVSYYCLVESVMCLVQGTDHRPSLRSEL